MRIGVIHLNQLGDLMFSLPVLASLKEGNAGSELVSVVREPLAPILLGRSLVEEVVTHRGSKDFLASAGRMAASDLDLVVCLSQSPRARLLAWASRAPHRVGLGGGPLASLLSQTVEKRGLPSTQNNLRLLAALGCPASHETYQGLLETRSEDLASARERLRERGWDGGPFVVLAPGASKGRSQKEWPTERFVAVAETIASGGRVAVFVGTEARSEIEHSPSQAVIDLTRRTSLGELMGLLEMAELMVGIDSGVLHLAAALGTRCVALFGPTDPRKTGPQGGGHLVLSASPDGAAPMEAITTAGVIAAVEEALTTKPRRVG